MGSVRDRRLRRQRPTPKTPTPKLGVVELGAGRCFRESASPFPRDIQLVALEELDRTLVLFGGRAAAERAEVLPATGLRILLARVEPVLSRFQFPNHWLVPAFERPFGPRRGVRPPTGAARRSWPGATALPATRR